MLYFESLLAKRNSPFVSFHRGAASHGLGTAQAMAISQRFGVYSSVGCILNGLFTALFTPIILTLLGLL
ncbi:LrgB family protein [Maribacter polysiphoniae]|uniref:LrgB family protein n=1 Tax=Maribacter polysiphoniae TaxID=429344 RepID=UPI0023559D13|nr:LrgB family protein [Maribacter polysiphoniae]